MPSKDSELPLFPRSFGDHFDRLDFVFFSAHNFGAWSFHQEPEHSHCESQQSGPHLLSPHLPITLLPLFSVIYGSTPDCDLLFTTDYFWCDLFSGCFLCLGKNHHCDYGFHGHQTRIQDAEMGGEKTDQRHSSCFLLHSSCCLCWMALHCSSIPRY